MTDQELSRTEITSLLIEYQTIMGRLFNRFPETAEGGDVLRRVLLRVTERYSAEVIRQVRKNAPGSFETGFQVSGHTRDRPRRS